MLRRIDRIILRVPTLPSAVGYYRDVLGMKLLRQDTRAAALLMADGITEIVLRAKLPRQYWLIINDLLVTFGQNQCLPISPLCSICPLFHPCNRVGVVKSR